MCEYENSERTKEKHREKESDRKIYKKSGDCHTSNGSSLLPHSLTPSLASACHSPVLLNNYQSFLFTF